MSQNNSKINKLISAGSEVAGAAVGGALGFIAGGSMLAAGASVVGVGVSKVLNDVASRYLSNNETTRIGATAAFSIDQIKVRLNKGEIIRQDDFFEANEKRSSAEEIFEGTLLAAKNTHEDRKAKYLGQFFANVTFDKTCLRDEANYQLQVAESLSYAQFVLLRLFSLTNNPYRLKESEYGGSAKVEYATIALLNTTKRLCDLGLVLMKIHGDENHLFIMEINNICPSNLQLSVSGQRLHTLFRLSAISDEEIENVAKWLR